MQNLIWYKQFDQYVFDLVVRHAAKVESEYTERIQKIFLAQDVNSTEQILP